MSIKLINKNLAYVDDSSSEEIARLKGTPTEPGVDGPFRNRSIEEKNSILRICQYCLTHLWSYNLNLYDLFYKIKIKYVPNT